MAVRTVRGLQQVTSSRAKVSGCQVTEPVLRLSFPEFLVVAPGQKVLKLDSEQSKNMIRAAEQEPKQRKPYIKEHLARLCIANDTHLRAFKLELDKEMVKV
jgi:hypothetical protein